MPRIGWSLLREGKERVIFRGRTHDEGKRGPDHFYFKGIVACFGCSGNRSKFRYLINCSFSLSLSIGHRFPFFCFVAVSFLSVCSADLETPFNPSRGLQDHQPQLQFQF